MTGATNVNGKILSFRQLKMPGKLLLDYTKMGVSTSQVFPWKAIHLKQINHVDTIIGEVLNSLPRILIVLSFAILVIVFLN